MKKIIILCIFLKVSVSALCQDTVMVYYDASWQVTTFGKETFYRRQIKNKSGWDIIDYFKSGKPQMSGAYADDSCKIRQGEFTWYQENGNITHIAHYNADKTDGKEIFYYAGGKKKLEGDNKMNKYDGDWTGYYESGAISGKAHFEDGKQVSASFYNEDGSVNKKMTEFEKEASFPGGLPALYHFISSQVRYPDDAVKQNIEGQVVVSFSVEPDGSVVDLKVTRSVDELLDREALRVLKRMPKWIPAVQGGIKVKAYMRQPVVFALRPR